MKRFLRRGCEDGPWLVNLARSLKSKRSGVLPSCGVITTIIQITMMRDISGIESLINEIPRARINQSSPPLLNG